MTLNYLNFSTQTSNNNHQLPVFDDMACKEWLKSIQYHVVYTALSLESNDLDRTASRLGIDPKRVVEIKNTLPSTFLEREFWEPSTQLLAGRNDLAYIEKIFHITISNLQKSYQQFSSIPSFDAQTCYYPTQVITNENLDLNFHTLPVSTDQTVEQSDDEDHWTHFNNALLDSQFQPIPHYPANLSLEHDPVPVSLSTPNLLPFTALESSEVEVMHNLFSGIPIQGTHLASNEDLLTQYVFSPTTTTSSSSTSPQQFNNTSFTSSASSLGYETDIASDYYFSPTAVTTTTSTSSTHQQTIAEIPNSPISSAVPAEQISTTLDENKINEIQAVMLNPSETVSSISKTTGIPIPLLNSQLTQLLSTFFKPITPKNSFSRGMIDDMPKIESIEKYIVNQYINKFGYPTTRKKLNLSATSLKEIMGRKNNKTPTYLGEAVLNLHYSGYTLKSCLRIISLLVWKNKNYDTKQTITTLGLEKNVFLDGLLKVYRHYHKKIATSETTRSV